MAFRVEVRFVDENEFQMDGNENNFPKTRSERDSTIFFNLNKETQVSSQFVSIQTLTYGETTGTSKV